MQNLPEIIIIGIILQGIFGPKSRSLADKFGSQNTGSHTGKYLFHLWLINQMKLIVKYIQIVFLRKSTTATKQHNNQYSEQGIFIS